jgi:AmiR/NasT family two-component response regulator
MGMESIKEILMSRDGMTEEEANDLIEQAKEDMNRRLDEGEMPDDICEEWFGLEPDYIMELMD